MTKKTILVLLGCLLLLQSGISQELQAKVTVLANRIGSEVDRKVFQTLQTNLNNFVNNRKWGRDAFQPNEKIECNFLLNIDRALENNVYQASLTIQAARPVYNSSYLSPLINYIDNGIVFRYVEFQPLEFNENRIQGSDPLASNLTATLAYYIYIIIGLDYNSFALKGGDFYFQKAQHIVNNAPESRDISGWKAFDGVRNRYWLAENLLSSRYNLIHDAMYNYYKMGLDYMYDDPNTARANIMTSLLQLNQVNTEMPNSMIIPFFFQGKASELIRVFSKASPADKARASELLQKLDISNANRYREELK